jgi:hypothetical protein
MDSIFMRSPEGEVKEVEATTAALTPLMVSGWIQIPPPATGQKPATPAKEEEQHG